jgi:hypothetical protein
MPKYSFELVSKDGLDSVASTYHPDWRCCKDEQPDDAAAIRSAQEWWDELVAEGIDMSRWVVRVEDFDGRLVTELWAGD